MTTLLAGGLGITVFGFGAATSMEVGHMAAVFGLALIALIAPRLLAPKVPISTYGFGALHVLTFFLVMAVASIEDERRQKDRLPFQSRQTHQPDDHGYHTAHPQ